MSCHYFGAFGAASKVKLINNLLVAVHIAATAEAMALGLKAGVDVDLMIKAVAAGSGGSTQFGIRAPWMAQRRFLPAQGTTTGLAHYFELIGDMADRVGAATPLLDRAVELYQRCIDMGLGEHDNAIMVDVIGGMPRTKSRRQSRRQGQKENREKIQEEIQAKEKNMIRVRKIAHASYEMPDLDKQAEYYTDILGLNLTAKDKDAVYLANTVDHHSVVLRKGDQAKCTRVGFQIGPEDDLNEFEKQTQATA